jgi:hypothetical protein
MLKFQIRLAHARGSVDRRDHHAAARLRRLGGQPGENRDRIIAPGEVPCLGGHLPRYHRYQAGLRVPQGRRCDRHG